MLAIVLSLLNPAILCKYSFLSKIKIYLPEFSAPKPKFRLSPFSSETADSVSPYGVLPTPENRFSIRSLPSLDGSASAIVNRLLRPSLRSTAMASLSSEVDENRLGRSAEPPFSVVTTLSTTGGRAAN